MAAMSEAQKFARALGNGLDSLNVNYQMIIAHFMGRGTSVQMNMFDLILAFLNKYASMYTHGDVSESDPAYNMCRISYIMVSAFNNDVAVGDEPGRHAAPLSEPSPTDLAWRRLREFNDQ